jgi:hypothetical protein
VVEAAGWALRRSLQAALVGALALGAPPARADASGWLAWSAPDECQNTSEVERRLSSLLGRSVESTSLPPTLVRMGWSAGRGWSVRVTVRLAAGSRDRSLDAPTCADAFDVVALSLALILDPNFGAASGKVEGAGDAPAVPEQSAPAVLVPELESPVASSMTPERATGAERPRDANSGAGDAASPPLRLVAGGGPLTDLSIFPVPQFGGGLELGLVAGDFRVELEADLLASESTRFSGAQYPVSFHSYFAGLRGCYTLELSSRFGWVACAGGELGSLGTHERGGDEHRAQGVLLAAEASTGPEFAATSWLRAFARARGSSPLIRHEFLLSEGSRVHELPWFSPQLQVGIAIDVTDFGGGGH